MSKIYRPSSSERGATAKWADVALEGEWPWVIVRDSKTEAGQRVPHIADVDEFPLVLGTNPEKQNSKLASFWRDWWVRRQASRTSLEMNVVWKKR